MVKSENHTHLNILLLTIVLALGPNILQARFSLSLSVENDTVKLYTPMPDSTLQEDTLQHAVIVADTLLLKADTLTVATIPQPIIEKEVQIDFNVNTEINYKIVKQFRTDNGKDNFLKGMDCSRQLDSLIEKTNSLRADYQKAFTNSDREAIGEQVLKLELDLIVLKAETDNYLNNARELEIGFWKEADELEYRKYLSESDSIANLIKLQNEPKPIEIIPVENEVKPENADTLTSNVQAPVAPVEPVQNGKVVYKIQIGNYNTKLPASVDKLFKKIATFRKIDTHLDEKGSTVYTIGELLKLNDAIKLQNQIRQEGVNDAFIIAIYNGKRITLNEAKEIQ